ncbi:MAG: right-handed parallel beta-helix repeat-containing protein [Candidatus Azobacteroides sp.]|nr:right-handed parallel beta-helix repeat-containing protein [Candidatus Azobacteroides sp.]
MKIFKLLLTGVYFFFITTILFSQTINPNSDGIVYVKGDILFPGDGSSWVNAVTELSDVLEACRSNPNIKEIWITSGTYIPQNIVSGGSEERDKSFVLPSGVKIYGGFTGLETDLSQRDPQINKTILSGAFTNSSFLPDSVYHVVLATGDMGGAILDGVTITGGKADELGFITHNSYRITKNYGGGIYLHNISNFTLANITVEKNSSDNNGGGMYLSNSSPDIQEITIQYNTSRNSAGGGIYLSESHPDMQDIRILNNYAGYTGGGMHLSTSNPDMRRVTIQHNTANTNGGGMYLQSSTPATMQDIDIQYNTATASGGGMYLNSSSDPQIEQFKIDNNTARSGGGIYNSSSSPTMKSGSISNNIYGTENNSMGGGMYNASSSPSITDIIISGNKLADATKLLISGGGIYNYNSSPVITNVIISNNTAVYSGGGVSNAGASSAPEFTNVLFTGNKVTQAGGQGGAMNTSHTTPDITFTMTNVTISNNTADQGSALYNSNVTGAEIRNTIIWENGNGTNNIYNALATDLTHKHSLIQGSYGGATWNTSVGTDGGNNIASDPKFADPALDDYTLDISSPAINKGYSDYITGADTDLAGNPRIYGRSVDMGAYEFQSDPVLPDHNGILYVAADGTGVGNSWDNAFPGLADALLYAESIPEIKQLWLKAGTYTPAYIAGNGTEEKDMAFVLPAGIKIYGGFAGTETDLADRDLTVNKTILSGVFTNNIQQADNVYHVVVATGDMQDAVLDAVTITGGKATGTFTSVTIHSKNVYKNYGGGIYLQETSNLTISNVSVTGNQSNTYGGGIYLNLAEATLKNIRVEGNASLSGYGGGICNNASLPVITHAIITDNTANYFGGGIHSLGATSHFTLTNILLARNTASRGGGMYTAAGIFEMTNATVTGNEATDTGNYGGGLYNIGATGSSVKNTIIWDNGKNNITKGANDYTEYFHSLIENGYTNNLWNTNIGIDGGNNIASDPLFTDPASGNYTLSVYSPAVDKGNNSYISGIDTDLAGNSRIYGSGQVDMGAYELQSLPSGPDHNGILYVSQTGDGTQLGNSWDNALPGLATGLLVGSTNPDVKEIRIKAGTYTPEYAFGNGTQERDKTFFLPAGIKIYGGFDGSEITPEDRDYETNKVILSGVTGATGTAADSVYHVVVAVGDMNGACLDGVTITGGNGGTGNVSVNGLNVSRSNGSGICIQQVSGFSLANISVTGNYGAGFGGGIYIGNTTDISLTNMTVDNNYSGNNDGGIYMSTISGLTLSDLTVKDNRINNGSGGGMYMTNITYSVFSNVTVNRNISPVSAGGILLSNSDSTLVIDNLEIKENNGSRGAGIYLSNSSPVMKSIRITENILRPANPTRGGGIYFTNSSSPEITDLILTGNRLKDGTITDTGMRGGGIYNENSSPVITNAIIKDNSCGYTGGGINSTGASSNPKLINVLITGNTLTHSGTFGGGIMSENGELELINVTISGNTALYGSGLYNNGSTRIDVKNSIIWDNGTGTNNIASQNPNTTGFYHSLIQRAHAADGTWEEITGTDHGGNISQDPLFTDPASSDYTLTIYSPAVNKGNKDYLAGILTDLAGNTRIYDNDPDMGAYELQQQVAGPDVNGILYISEDGDGTKTGSSWDDAFPGLANALKFAETNSTITQLWIKAGTYVPIHLAGNGDLE